MVFVLTAAKSVFGALGAIARFACTMFSGRPLLSCRHVLPPSTDLKMPPPFPLNTPFYHGPPALPTKQRKQSADCSDRPAHRSPRCFHHDKELFRMSCRHRSTYKYLAPR